MEGKRERGAKVERKGLKSAWRGVNWAGHYRVFTLLQRCGGRMVAGAGTH